MLNFFNIARNTFRESLREPIFFILLASAMIMIGLFPSLSMFVFREQVKLVVDSSMATTLVFGLLTAVLCASHTISREMRNGTVLLLMSKPVHRWTFVVAKIVGIISALTVFVFICNVASLISIRIAKDQFQLDFTAMYIYFAVILATAVFGMVRNYMNQAPFSSNAIIMMLILMPLYAIVLNFIPVRGEFMMLRFDIIPALILLFFAVWGMGTITVLFSTRLDMVANLTVCTIIFLLGLVSNYLFADGNSSGLISFIYKVIYAILPNWQFFWMADAIADHQPVPIYYIAWAFVYIVLYMLFCSIWAMALFQNREIAKDSR